MTHNSAEIKLLGISATDPHNRSTATGSRYYLWSKLEERGVLLDSFSPYPSNWIVNFYKLLSFRPNMQDWKANWHSSVLFRRHLTRRTCTIISGRYAGSFNATLQTGAYYNISKVWTGYKALLADNNCVLAHATNINYRSPEKSFRKQFVFEKEVYHSMDHIFSFSTRLAESFIKDFGCAEDKVKVVHAGVNIDEELISNLDKDYSEPVVLFSGFDFTGKGGEVLLKAFKDVIKEFPSAKLIMLGPKPQPFPSYVINHGPLLQTDPDQMALIAESYRKATIFALPTLGDAFPNVIREAMAARMPCVSTDIAGVPDMVVNGVTGYFVPKSDSKALAEKLIYLMRNPDLCRQFGEAGYQRYRELFTWDTVCSKIISGIESGIR